MAYNENIGGKDSKLNDFINNPNQQAVVYAVYDILNNKTAVKCYSPIFGDLVILDAERMGVKDIHRGDIVVVSRAFDEENKEIFVINENITQQEIQEAGVEKILKRFNSIERQKLAFLAAKKLLTK